ncbi:hypothetical protein [Bosea sp. PAMC 26642]|nr:hypothetical protein [Bosea sp. PAMC 26642]
MRVIALLLPAYLNWLCDAFRVNPDSLTKGRRGNLPPPSGGIGSY